MSDQDAHRMGIFGMHVHGAWCSQAAKAGPTTFRTQITYRMPLFFGSLEAVNGAMGCIEGCCCSVVLLGVS